MDKVKESVRFFLPCVPEAGSAFLLMRWHSFCLSGIRNSHGGSRRKKNCKWRIPYGSFCGGCKLPVLYGVAKLTKEMEKVSGDNYICRQEEAGRFVMCLSDGMGSGVEACRESEEVVELLEQFLESGFTQETAAKMVNSALVMKGQEGIFSTVDICAVDLYTGICTLPESGGFRHFYQKGSLGGGHFFRESGGRADTAGGF